MLPNNEPCQQPTPFFNILCPYIPGVRVTTALEIAHKRECSHFVRRHRHIGAAAATEAV